MEIAGIARALHVLAVVVWIGGVAMVTTVLLPTVRRHAGAAEQVELFERLESRFAAQARWTTLLAGATGFWLVWHFNLWTRFSESRYWWMQRDPSGTFSVIQRFHWVLLALSLITVFGAVVGSHGYL